jgi:hypothetical protein
MFVVWNRKQKKQEPHIQIIHFNIMKWSKNTTWNSLHKPGPNVAVQHNNYNKFLMLLYNTLYTSAACIYTHTHTHTHTDVCAWKILKSHKENINVTDLINKKYLKMQNKPGNRNNSGLLATIPLNIRSRENPLIAKAISTNYYTPKHKLKILIS